VSATHEPSIRVGRGRRGRGVFAARAFREGEVIETVPAIAVPEEDVIGAVRDYAFSSSRPDRLILMLGYGMLYNHSDKPNVFHRIAGRLTIEFVALRDIEEGEELVHDYGPEYWEDRGKTPK
jgi:SET domain-containing protein